uniref:Uncharacterized protein n=1 Tax=Cacopsylla melanoneura TaxID=428564 RepID=A0A8D8R8R8_9HEMI
MDIRLPRTNKKMRQTGMNKWKQRQAVKLLSKSHLFYYKNKLDLQRNVKTLSHCHKNKLASQRSVKTPTPHHKKKTVSETQMRLDAKSKLQFGTNGKTPFRSLSLLCGRKVHLEQLFPMETILW